MTKILFKNPTHSFHSSLLPCKIFMATATCYHSLTLPHPPPSV